MQVSISPPRQRPSIAIHIQPSAHHSANDFTLPRKRKRSSTYSSSDEDSRSSSAFTTSTALRSLDGYSSSSPIKEHGGKFFGHRGAGGSGSVEGGGEGDSEGEKRHHKRVRRTIAQMDGLSLYPTSPIAIHQVQKPHYVGIEGYGQARSSFGSDLSGQAQIVSPMSNTSGTSYGSMRGEAGVGYHAVDGPELLEVDEAFMPREHGHDHDHDTWDAYHRSLVPEIEDLPAPPRSSLPIRPSPHIRTLAGSNDIKMGGTGWYEPEKDRIVITDLDDSDIDTDVNIQDKGAMDDDENPFHTFKVSNAYLQRFGKPAKAPEIPPAPSTIIESAGAECQALVLYRPSFPIYKHVPLATSNTQTTMMSDNAIGGVDIGGSGDAMELDD